jgi:hypothetical protein
MKVLITYKDGHAAAFDAGTGFDALELDLDTEHGQSIFSICVYADGRLIFSAYHWHNDPGKEI